MANMIQASIYGAGSSNNWNNSNGVLRLFPVGTFMAYPTSQVFTGATAVTIIEMLPSATQVHGEKYYTTKTVASILADSNAPLA